ncbi:MULTISPECIES: TraB/GumN family protein [unclassified Sphingomonas]|uniref:TraB/GumN family protein n=1 Tax=unclassified Sphingomonas TaxID=196159 RepID=UPI0006FF96BD|nr:MULTISPECIES: TraB/GumN family protein [unclassified Sphingomonas]KQX20265.1 polysaccharide biosynthesis protein GumN [Sphingomonas sp. Root1294]KQY67515.1 polysaccharide biosynthesis protein GumN [Sphingomonas sp. Root50]KRB90892.1 polysaccharide biosynthesis protein GumN [Sphingomonas sp. Root720]
MRFLRRAATALLALLIAAPATAAPALWKFGDADTTIYLFGTIHALPPGYAWQDARIETAMAASDTLVIETVIDKDPQAIARLFPPPDPSLPPIVERVPEKSRPAFEAVLKKSGLDPATLSRMPTWQASFMLMGAMMNDLGIQRDAGVEGGLMPAFAPSPDAKDAKNAKPRKVEALETASEQLALFANLSEADQREMLASFADGEGDAKSDYAKLLSAWASGDDAAIAKAFADDKDLTPHLREILLRKRNANWAEWLKARLATPGTVFVAVGAGHLAGPLSVQAMLAAEGITVERVENQPVRKQRAAHHDG